jgi:hypothetical protein
MLHPVTFSFPEEKILKEPSVKTKILSDLIPGRPETYIYGNETDYYNEYRTSLFATTIKKAGWDCMRHYEILGNGCIPYFPDIENCPKNTMALLPKDLIMEGNALYARFKGKRINELSDADTAQCNVLVQKLLNYTREHLTTTRMARYILDKSSFTNAKNVLYLSRDTAPDYLRCVTLHGFKTLAGVKCHDYPKIPHIYKSRHIHYASLYGKGITYTNLLEPALHDDALDRNIADAIRNKVFDVVIYGSYHRGMPLFDLVSTVYKPNEIILLCGEDIHACNYNTWVNKGHTVFVRELE